MTTREAVVHRATQTSDQLTRGLSPVLQKYPLHDYLRLIDNRERIGKYQLRGEQLTDNYRRLRQQFPDQSCEYQALLLSALISQSASRMHELELPIDVEDITLRNFDRILDLIDHGEIQYMQLGNDQFDKDLAAAGLWLICAGAQKIHRVKLPNHFIKRHPFKWLHLVKQVGMGGLLYDMHTDSNDPLLMAEFNEDGWTAFYNRVAALMKKSSVQGIIGTSWFFDPALKKISPRLSYLREIVMDNGGISIKAGTSSSTVRNATSTSKTRRALYEQGEYIPTGYALIWPRQALINWSESQHDE